MTKEPLAVLYNLFGFKQSPIDWPRVAFFHMKN